jgi:hypothetical protein
VHLGHLTTPHAAGMFFRKNLTDDGLCGGPETHSHGLKSVDPPHGKDESPKCGMQQDSCLYNMKTDVSVPVQPYTRIIVQLSC